MTDVITKVAIGGVEYPFAGGGGSEGAEVVYLTQAEYDALPASKLTDGKIYKVKTTGVVPGGSTDASDVEYDNTTSGLTADNVQDAIDEVSENIDNLKNSTVINTPDTTAPTHSSLTYTLNADGVYLIDIENGNGLSTDVVLDINGETIATVGGSNGISNRLSMTLFDGKIGDIIHVNTNPVKSGQGYFRVKKINRIYSLVYDYD